jgi:hypothetical protein
MSTTIPFTLIEGAMALPSTRPLGPVSRTLGREWALLPPNVSLRIELKALYTAVLRTFCLSSQAMRSMCKWDRPLPAEDARQLQREAVHAREPAAIAAGASVGFAAAATNAAVGARGAASAATGAAAAGVAGGTAAGGGAAAGASFGSGATRPVRAPHTPLAPHRKSNVPLASAFAIGGAALLAWIVLDHPQRHAPVVQPVAAPVKPVAPATAPADPRSASSNAARTSKPTSADSMPAVTQDVAPIASAPSTREVANELTRDTARRNNTARATTRNAAPQPSVAVYTASPVARPSAAGDYSPVEPDALGGSEYAAVHTFARTRGADYMQHADRMLPQRSLNAADPSIEAGWISHLSQRRVTEVPELFSQ